MSLRSKMLSLGTAFTLLASLTGTAAAGDEEPKKAEADQEEPDQEEADQEEAQPEKPRQVAANASAEVKAAKGVEERVPQEVGDTFAAGDKVFIWNRVKGAKDTTIRHVWKRNGSQIADISLDIGSHNWRTWSRSSVSAGEYEVAVLAEDDSVLGEVSFTVE